MKFTTVSVLVSLASGDASDTATTAFVSAAAVSIVLPLLMKSWSKKRGDSATGDMRYSNAFRYFSLFCAIVPPCAFALLFAVKSPNPSHTEWLIAGSLIAFFLVSGLIMTIEAYGVHHRCHDAGIEYATPWSTSKTLRWADVEQVKWHGALKLISFRGAAGSTRLWLYPLVGGIDEMSKLALKGVPRPVLEASGDGLVALQRMAQGHALDLLTAPIR